MVRNKASKLSNAELMSCFSLEGAIYMENGDCSRKIKSGEIEHSDFIEVYAEHLHRFSLTEFEIAESLEHNQLFHKIFNSVKDLCKYVELTNEEKCVVQRWYCY